MSLEKAISMIPSSSSLAIGGSMIRRQPNALIRELIRQDKNDLDIRTFATGTSTDLLAANNSMKSWEGIYSGLFWYGQAYNFRKAVEKGEITVKDYSESTMSARLRAASQGNTFAPTKSFLGTGMAEYNKEDIKEIVCPFTGEKYHAVPALCTDFTLIHGYVGDEYGNIQMPLVRDTDDMDFHFAMASNRLIVTVEKIVSHKEISKYPTLTYIPHNLVEAIVHVPYGSHPVACDGFYDVDEEHLNMYVEMSKSGKSLNYINQFIKSGDENDYFNKIGGFSRVNQLDVEDRGKII